ncbi:MFS general substrate transporter [Patellaria atrata CBS 101060]|uniref:MFS general substrate transporter n=1 Tax=Patellaria atrata CBS 101060 TaxID=1346257 RepID=A0A9P4VPU6_9PEZI|nr:MFS general substrate transporter [Patellaria atrata CBS 101060]
MPTEQPPLPTRQLLILSICRFAQPFALGSIFPCIPNYIEDLGIPQSKVAIWLGALAATFALCESMFAIPWAFFSDYAGRKLAIVIGLLISMVANICLGFCTSIAQSMVCFAVAGAANGNLVVMRTTIAELVLEKELQSTAYSFLPISASIASIIGPVVGGNLGKIVPSDHNLLALFQSHRFVLPNLVSGFVFLPGIFTAILLLEETCHDRSLRLFTTNGYETLETSDASNINDSYEADIALLNLHEPTDEEESPKGRTRHLNDFENTEGKIVTVDNKRRTWQHFANIYMWINSLSGLHTTGFDHLLPVFLHSSTARIHSGWSLIQFAHGFGKDSQSIGTLLAGCGIIPILTNLFLYPRVARTYGRLKTLRLGLTITPFIYATFPFSVVPSHPAVQMICLIGFLLVKIIVSVSILQCCMILLTNSVPPRDLASLNGLNFAVASICRGLGSFISGLMFTFGMSHGYAILPYWALAGFSSTVIILACGISS